MDIVVERIAVNGQPDRRDVETCRAVGIGMGWFLEPAFDYRFAGGHEKSIGMSAGLLIAIPEAQGRKEVQRLPFTQQGADSSPIAPRISI